MKFSILVPVYNVEKYLADCVRSVLNQSYQNYEIILVDDGSTDNSGIICDEFAENDKRIKVYHKANRGLLHTRRFAISKATAECFVFLDSDDTLKLNALEMIVNTFAKYDCDCVVFGMDRVLNGKIEKAFHPEFAEERFVTDKRDIYRTLFFGEAMNGLCRKAVKASVFHDFDYNEYYETVSNGEDRLQTIEIAKNADGFVFLTEALYNYTQNPASMTHRKNYSGYSKNFTVSRRVYDFLKDEGVFTEHDFDEYRSHCMNSLTAEISYISKTVTEAKEAIRICSEITENPDYRQMYSGKIYSNILGKRAIIYTLLKRKMYKTIVYLIRIRG